MTLYAITARFKPDVEDQRQALHSDFGDHMGQPMLHIRLVGALTENGARIGLMVLIEAETRQVVDHFLSLSPYGKADLYERIDVDELTILAGGLH
jgi:hypothetical protein